MLGHLNQLCLLPDEQRGKYGLVQNVSISPGPYPFSELEPMNVATRVAAAQGFIIVFAVGNNGPDENTLSPWSVAPWVIGVGATDQDGKELWKGSSVGAAGDEYFHPTVVAPGKDIPVSTNLSSDRKWRHGTMVTLILAGYKGETREELSLESGTSLAAPHVARICGYIIHFIFKLWSATRVFAAQGQMDEIMKDPNWSSWPMFDILDDFPEAINGTNWSIFNLLLRLKLSGINYNINNSPTMVKKILEAMAIPMEGYKPYKVGAGFVDDSSAEHFLKRFSARDFIHFFVEGRMSNTDLDQLDEQIGVLIPSEVVDRVLERLRGEIDIANYSVLDQGLPTFLQRGLH
jgi:hypothetical protein